MNAIRILHTCFFAIVVSWLISVAVFISETGIRLDTLKAFTIQSGSMEPVVPLGSVVITGSTPVYFPGEIITFSDVSGKQFTTHRVLSRKDGLSYYGAKSYLTKGDANEEPDIQETAASNVIGKTVLIIPFVGFLSTLVRTKIGLIVLIYTPGAIIILQELLSIFRQVKLLNSRKTIRTLSGL